MLKVFRRNHSQLKIAIGRKKVRRVYKMHFAAPENYVEKQGEHAKLLKTLYAMRIPMLSVVAKILPTCKFNDK